MRSLASENGVVVYSVTTDETRPLGGTGVEYVDWSPDGRTIAYFTRTSPNAPDENVQFWLMDADGTNERIVVPEIGADAWPGTDVVTRRRAHRLPTQQPQSAPRSDGSCSEETEVVLLTVNADDPREPAGTEVVIPPPQTSGPDGQAHVVVPVQCHLVA